MHKREPIELSRNYKDYVEKSLEDGSISVSCDGFWIIIDEYGNYFEPMKNTNLSSNQYIGDSFMYFKKDETTSCKYQYSLEASWFWFSKTENIVENGSTYIGDDPCQDAPAKPKNEQFMIKYN